MVERLMEKYNNKSINFSVETVIFNKLVEPRYDIKNFLCLVAKQYIYRCKCTGERLEFAQFKEIVNRVEINEKYYATKSNKLEKHYKKWYNRDNYNNQMLEFITEYINQM